MGWADDVYWDGDPEGQMFDYDGGSSKLPIKCKFCGTTGLHWVEVEELNAGVLVRKRWKLYDAKDNLHLCQRGKV